MDLSTRQWRQVEVVGVFVVWAAVYLLLIGPTLGTVFGFEQAAVTGEGYRLTADQVLSPRGIGFLGSLIGVTIAYAYIRPRLSGMSPREYWQNE